MCLSAVVKFNVAKYSSPKFKISRTSLWWHSTEFFLYILLSRAVDVSVYWMSKLMSLFLKKLYNPLVLWLIKILSVPVSVRNYSDVKQFMESHRRIWSHIHIELFGFLKIILLYFNRNINKTRLYTQNNTKDCTYIKFKVYMCYFNTS